MAIKKDITITIENKISKMSEEFYVYQGDKNIDIYFTIVDNRFEFSTIVPKQSSITIRKPDGNIIPTSAKVPIVDNKVQFTITPELVDELDEIGEYYILIHLYDDLDSRISIPEISFEVRQPLVSTNVLTNSGFVQSAVLDEINDKLTRLDSNGNYIKTVWNKGDVITKENLNKIENQLSDTSSQLAEIKNDIIKNNKVKTLLVSRNTNVNGLQVIELGFKPKFIRILAVLAGSNCANYNSDGSYDGNRIVCISKYGNDSVAPIYTSNIVHMHSGGAYNSAVISNVSDTGFALDWSGTQTLPGGIVILMKVEALGG